MSGAMPTILAIIPARGGSRGLPGKNILAVGGRPMIAWSIDAARHAASIDRVVVSTDDKEIAAVARACGGEVPGLRPAELARDDTPGVDPIVHMVQSLRTSEDYAPDYVMVLQPTSPLRTAGDIEAAVALLRARKAAAVVSVCAVTQHLAWMKRVDPDGRMAAPHEAPPRQEVQPQYVLNGAIYLVATESLMATHSLYAEPTYVYVMPAERSIDVDAQWDLHLADLALRFPMPDQP
ncbi:MAG: acylneuraminate cytidylyltransferase family protein [Vicinamibacterales bacterium]